MKKTAVIIGASSGIGEALAYHLATKNYRLVLTARRLEKLQSIKQSLKTECIIREIDVSHPEAAIRILKKIIKEVGKIDLLIISVGTGFINSDLNFAKEQQTIDVNVSGFTAIAGEVFKHFTENGSGHLVGISSILTLRGNSDAPAYNASKAFMSNYLEGLRFKAAKQNLNIIVTDIRPGYVDTAMAEGDNLFWVSSSEKAAHQIYNAIKNKKKVVYITKRWRLIAWFMQMTPDFFYRSFF